MNLLFCGVTQGQVRWIILTARDGGLNTGDWLGALICSSRANKRSSNWSSNSCSSMRTKFRRFCSWSASSLQRRRNEVPFTVWCSEYAQPYILMNLQRRISNTPYNLMTHLWPSKLQRPPDKAHRGLSQAFLVKYCISNYTANLMNNLYTKQHWYQLNHSCDCIFWVLDL